MKHAPTIAVLLIAASVGLFAAGGPAPLVRNWEIRFHAFTERLNAALNASTLPVLTASVFPPDQWWKMVQDKIPSDAKFPCLTLEDKPEWRSRKTPKSVHQLRPGDIKVIAALGDSLSAAAGALEPTPLGFFTDHRGVSFVGGGDKTWREYTTLPNILKVFNPHLHGYANGAGTFFSENAVLNVAVSGSLDDDLHAQAQYLLFKMSQDPNVDMEKDWKLINILIGQNDICSGVCANQTAHSPDAHKARLQEVLDFIKEHFPRTFVNLIGIVDTTLPVRYPSSSRACEIINQVNCPCLYLTPNLTESRYQMSGVVREYQKKEEELAKDVRYQNKNDFTVVWQPFLLAANAPLTAGAPENELFSKVFTSDPPLLTPECFHFNQRGGALGARLLWNNMLEPVGNKTKTLEDVVREGIKCPTKSNPYLFTGKNSETYYKHCRQ